MAKYINPPRLSTSFSKDGKRIKNRFANILDTRIKKGGFAVFVLIALSVLIFSGSLVGGEVLNDENINNTITEDSESINVVIFGKDFSERRSDVILLCSLDDNGLQVTQIPRDTRTEFSGGSKIGRMETTEDILKSVEQITGINCTSYVDVKLERFRNIIDAIGGIDFDVPTDMNYEDPYQQLKINLNSGTQHLNGEQAEMLMRYRKDSPTTDSTGYIKGYANGDMDRLSVQKDLYYAITDKMLNNGVNSTLLETIKENINSNLTISKISIIANRILKLKSENISIEILSGTTEKIGMENFYIHNSSDGNDISDTNDSQIN